MLDLGKASYTNHLGEVFWFGEDTGAFVGDSELFDLKRSYSAETNAYRTVKVVPLAIPVTVWFNGDRPRSIRDFIELTEADALAQSPGRLRFGDWWIEGMFVSSENTSWEHGAGEMVRSAKFLSESPIWHRDVVKIFDPDQTRAAVINEGFVASSVTIEAYGPCDSVSVTIGECNYDVACAVPEGGRLVIDGLSKSVTLVGADGGESSALDEREGTQVKGSGYYVFEQIPKGYSAVTWRTHQRIRLTVHEQRLEVKLP